VLIRFQHAVGCGSVSGPTLKEGKEPLYRWETSRKTHIERVLDLLCPWLGIVKVRQLCSVLRLPDRTVMSGWLGREEALAWAAGLFDGEGSVYLAKHRTHAGYFRLETAITQSDANGVPFVLDRFERIVRIGQTRGPYPPPPGHDPIYRWKAHRAQEITAMVAVLRPWLGEVKRDQADRAIAVVSAQTPLPRGNPAWGNRKTHCVKGHEYATARIRPFRGRGVNTEPQRASHQCLACVRDHARRKRIERKQRAAADQPPLV
jgi:hypothetical protein